MAQDLQWHAGMKTKGTIIALATGVAVAVGVALGLYMAHLAERASERRIAELDRTLRQGFDRNARTQVESAVSMLDVIARRAARGEITLEEAKKAGGDLLRELRYDKDGYFWADTTDGVAVVLLGRKDAEGKKELDDLDAKGTPYIRECIRKAQAGGGFTVYYFSRKEGGAPLPKRTYTLEFKPFGWIVGTGNYIDDIDATVAAARAEADAQLRGEYGIIALGVLVTSLLALVAAFVLGARVSRPIATLVSETQALRDAVQEGDLSKRMDVEAVPAEFRPVLAGMNEVVDGYARPLAVTAECVRRIAAGDIPAPITERFHGDFNRIVEALNGCIGAISGLVSEMKRMNEAQLAGDVDAYVDEARFQGAFQALARGVNENVRMHVNAILEGLGTLRKYGEGDFSAAMRKFPGKQIVMTETINAVRTNLMAVAAEVRAVGEAAAQGKLSVRADTSRLHGEWKAVADGVNRAIEIIVAPLRVLAEHVEKISHGEIPPRRTNQVHGDIVPMQQSLNRCLESLSRLVADTEALARAAVAGDLSARADASRHEGAFRSALEGVNRTLDAVTAPVNDAARTLDALAKRDLRARVTARYEGDHARIAASVNATAEALHDAMTQVSSAVEQVSGAAAQIAASSQAVASGASEQAASLTETTSSVESVSGMTRRSADSAQAANQLAVTARDAAAQGAGAVEGMQQAIARIRASAEGTSEIIRDINDIAFQTNLLALNAAVEAARAGEAGRGFAVVAEEVRSLALRAKEAAAKTEERIRQSVKEAGEGEASAQRVAGELGKIAEGIGKVTDIVAEIAGAASEQATAIDQVTRAVGEMDKVTQQNAASAEESSSAASELSGQAEELAAMVGSFRLEGGGAQGRGASPAAAGALPARALAPAASRRANGKANGIQAKADDVFPMDAEGVKDF